MTPAQASRSVYGSRSPREALRRSECARRHGLDALAEALWCRAMALRATGYSTALATYTARTAEALAEVAS